MSEARAMKVIGLSWLGVGVEDFPEAIRFFRDVLGLSLMLEDERGVAMFQIGERQVLEVFGPDTAGHDRTSPPVTAFEVEDVAAAKAELLDAGIELVGDVGSWNGFEWLYFKGPGDNIFAVKKTPLDGWEKRG